MALPLFENGQRVRLILSDQPEKTLGFGLYVGPVPKTGYHAVIKEAADGKGSIFEPISIYAPQQLVAEDR